MPHFKTELSFGKIEDKTLVDVETKTVWDR